MIDSKFRNQVDLLLEVLGRCLVDKRLALKGGTAINLFYQDMPRLSVDIDLTYVKINSRQDFINDLSEIFNSLQGRLRQFSPEIARTSEGIPKQLRISNQNAKIKIEINLVLRGAVYPLQERTLCQRAQDEFQKFLKVRCLSFEDLYAGKFCAALDRQHPRDLYDVKKFFERFIFTEPLKKAFLVYLVSGNRPLSEMLQPNLLDQQSLYEREFRGMTTEEVPYVALCHAHSQLVKLINEALTIDDRRFLVSFKQGNPQWELLGFEGVESFPGVKWKLLNIQKMSKEKKTQALENLRERLKIKGLGDGSQVRIL